MSDSFESNISLFFFFLLDSLMLVDLSLPLLWVITSCWQDPVCYSVHSTLVTQPKLKVSSGELRAFIWSVLLKLICVMLNTGYLPERFLKIIKENEGANEGL